MKRFTLICALASAFTAGTSQNVQKPDIEAQSKVAFAWLNSVGFKDKFKDLIYIDWWRKDVGETRKDAYRTYGIALKPGLAGKQITYMSFNLTRLVDDLTDKDLGFETGRADVKEALTAELKNREAAEKRSDVIEYWGTTQPVVLAMIAHENGFPELSKRFFTQAVRASKGKAVLAELKEEVGYAQFSEMVEVIFDNKESWPQIQTRVGTYLKYFPEHGLAKRADEYVLSLGRMAAAEKLHAASPPLDPVAELVYQLRNDVGEPFPVHPKKPRGKPVHAGEKLLSLGWDAVPALISALNDESLTHNRGYDGGPMADYKVSAVETVGEVAYALLEAVTFQSFYLTDEDREKGLTVKAKVEKWWSENRDEGELAILSDLVLAGDVSSRASEALARRYPAEAVRVLKKALASTVENINQVSMIEALGMCPGNEALDLIRGKMLNGSNLYLRVTAAQALWPKRPDEALVAMIGEWERFKPSEEDIVDNLVAFLEDTGRIEAIEAFTKDVRKQPVELRRGIMWVFSGESGIRTRTTSLSQILPIGRSSGPPSKGSS